MKKTFSVILFIAISSWVIGQTEFDAARIGLPDLNGSARYMGLAGAYGALGGDASAIKDNPAGLGVFRSSEIAFSFNYGSQNSSSTWYNINEFSNSNKLGINQVSYVWNILYPNKETGLLNSNFSFTYNKSKSFNREIGMSGPGLSNSLTDIMVNITNGLNYNDLSYKKDPYNNLNIGWLSELGYQAYLIDTIPGEVDQYRSVLTNGQKVFPYNYIKESGSVNEYSIGWGGNFNDNFFLGTNVNLVSWDYQFTSRYREDFDGTQNYFDLINYISQTGLGFNLKLGAIYMPFNNFRLGLALHSPSMMFKFTDTHYADIYSSYMTNAPEKTPEETNKFDYVGPWQIQTSAAYLFGKKGLLSVEYDRIAQKSAQYKNMDAGFNIFNKTNNAINTDLENTNFIKVGGEYKLNDNVALRAGYAFANGVNPKSSNGKIISYNSTSTSTEYLLNKGIDFFTLGIGYRESTWFLDFSYALKIENNEFYPFNQYFFGVYSYNPATVKTNTNNFAVTLGFKL